MPRLTSHQTAIALISLVSLTACDFRQPNEGRPSGGSKSPSVAERLDKEEALEAVRLQPTTDPVWETTQAYRKQMAAHFYAQEFDALEKEAASARASKELFGDGSWKIVQFYDSFDRGDDDAQGVWNVTEDTFKAWLKALPDSLTARIAYADFLTSYAWHARGSGYANTVTDEGWRLMDERLSKSHKVLLEASKLPEKDPVLYLVAFRIALGKSLDEAGHARLLKEARAAEPTFWGYDTARAYSLLPRWFGNKGDWEAFAAEAAKRPDGLGAEVYARIVMRLAAFHGNIFKDSKASWPKTKEGLDILHKKYPDSVEILSYAALLATFAHDNKAAKAYFEELGDRFLEKNSERQTRIWPSKESFIHYRKWARTGKW
jgi:hypothetical protein